jgi:hypothetical protein
LSVEQLVELAVESQALVAKARSMAAANLAMRDPATPPRALLKGETIDEPPCAEPT